LLQIIPYLVENLQQSFVCIVPNPYILSKAYDTIGHSSLRRGDVDRIIVTLLYSLYFLYKVI